MRPKNKKKALGVSFIGRCSGYYLQNYKIYRALNQATKSYKRALKKACFHRIYHYDVKLSAQPFGSRAFWSLTKAIKTNFCKSLQPDATYGKEESNTACTSFAQNSRLDNSGQTPHALFDCGSLILWIRVTNKQILKTLLSLDVTT